VCEACDAAGALDRRHAGLAHRRPGHASLERDDPGRSGSRRAPTPSR
jgi:hypothetical protein